MTLVRAESKSILLNKSPSTILEELHSSNISPTDRTEPNNPRSGT